MTAQHDALIRWLDHLRVAGAADHTITA